MTPQLIVSKILKRFFISVLDGHVYPYFPFISDTGAIPPESCIFAQMLYIGAALMAVIAYIRYYQVDYVITSENVEMKKLWNTLGFICGCISCLGITTVGSFQETAVLAVHALGAVMVFGIGSLYLLIQARITYGLRHVYNKNRNYGIGPRTVYLRIITAICFTCLYNIASVCAFVALMKFSGTSIIWWTEEHSGYYEHLTAAIAEWLMVVLFLIYIYSFTYEFRFMEFDKITIKTKDVLVAKPKYNANAEQSA